VAIRIRILPIACLALSRVSGESGVDWGSAQLRPIILARTSPITRRRPLPIIASTASALGQSLSTYLSAPPHHPPAPAPAPAEHCIALHRCAASSDHLTRIALLCPLAHVQRRRRHTSAPLPRAESRCPSTRPHHTRAPGATAACWPALLHRPTTSAATRADRPRPTASSHTPFQISAPAPGTHHRTPQSPSESRLESFTLRRPSISTSLPFQRLHFERWHFLRPLLHRHSRSFLPCFNSDVGLIVAASLFHSSRVTAGQHTYCSRT